MALRTPERAVGATAIALLAAMSVGPAAGEGDMGGPFAEAINTLRQSNMWDEVALRSQEELEAIPPGLDIEHRAYVTSALHLGRSVLGLGPEADLYGTAYGYFRITEHEDGIGATGWSCWPSFKGQSPPPPVRSLLAHICLPFQPPWPVAVGQVNELDGHQQIGLPGLKELSVRLVSEDDTVTTPAVSFRSCLRYEIVATRDEAFVPREDQFRARGLAGTRHLWLAPGVGPVKFVGRLEDGLFVEGHLVHCELAEVPTPDDPWPIAAGNVWLYECSDGTLKGPYVERWEAVGETEGSWLLALTVWAARPANEEIASQFEARRQALEAEAEELFAPRQ
jgi:hypothetical protein